MNTLRIAFRNIFRNRRRSVTTMLAISVSAISILLFGGFVFSIVYGLQTGIVQDTGHLHIYQKGYFEYGSGDPASYGISHYEELIQSIQADEQLSKNVKVVTPILNIFGIAGNFAKDASKTFFGRGIVPSDLERMRKWNDYSLRNAVKEELGLSDQDTEGGVVGNGMGRILQLCDELHIDCKEKKTEKSDNAAKTTEDFSDLTAIDFQDKAGEPTDKRPKLDLLAATSSGAPNVITLYVNKAVSKGVKEIDDNYVAMHLTLAQRLLYGQSEPKVTGIVLQLKHTGDIPAVKARLEKLLSQKNGNYEIRDFKELAPNYGQIISLFAMIFTFIALVMGVIVIFTIVNTMSMSVMERINEIGTLRALGVRRHGILKQFLAEGCLLGGLGATIGVAVAVVIGFAINAAGITWTPPNNVQPVFLTILILENPFLLPGCWLGLILLTTASSLVPARKAGRMMIVDALRHI